MEPGTPEREPTLIERGTIDVAPFAEEIAAAPKNHKIGTTLLRENERVRIWEITMKPGERVPFHAHVHPFLWVCVEGGRQLARGADGSFRLTEMPAGASFWSDPGDTADIHSIENVGQTTIRYTTVELLK